MALERSTRERARLNEYLHILRRRKFIVLAALVVVPVAAVLLSLRQVALYQASADVLLSRQNLSSSLAGLSDPNSFYPERSAATQANLARTTEVAERVLDVTGIEDRSPGWLLAATSVTIDPEADLMRIAVTDTDPVLAERLAREYARQFTIYRRELDTAPIKDALVDIESQLRSLEEGPENSALRQSLIQRREQLQTMEVLGGANAYLIEARGAYQVAPQPLRNGILGLCLGLILGIGLAFLREATDTRLRSADDISERLGLPLLARLAEPPRRLRGRNRLAMLAEPHGIQAEAFRMLRTNLEFVNLEREARTIMITSAVQAEGKSTTAANLAIAFARAGRRVILVDLDLRRPFLDRFFGLGGRPGLADVALGHVSLDEALVNAFVPDKERAPSLHSGNGDAPGATSSVAGMLQVLPSGPIPPNPGEFVGSQTLTDILEELGDRADLVLIDAPPLLHVGDAMALSAKVDALLLVARLNVLRRPMLTELQRILATSPAAKLGFVLAGADAEPGYGYGGGYYYESPKRGRERVA